MTTPEINWKSNYAVDESGDIRPIDDVYQEFQTEQRAARLSHSLGAQATAQNQEAVFGHDIQPEDVDELNRQILESLAQHHEDWAWDMKRAFDDYRFAELTPMDIAAMSKDDRKTLALHFQRFWRLVRRDIRLISAVVSSTSDDTLELETNSVESTEVKSLYGLDRTPEELLDYRYKLRVLESGLEKTGIVHALLEELHTDYSESSPKRIDSVLFKDRAKKGDCRVSFVYHADGSRKAKLERIPLVERKLSS